MTIASRRRVGTLVAAAALAGSAVALSAGPAQAAGNVPATGELCTAVENIQFFDGATGANGYVVAAGDFIRIDSYSGGFFAFGHGSGHSSRAFQWLHSNGVSRIANCH